MMSARQAVLKKNYKQNANGIVDTDKIRTTQQKELKNLRKEGRAQTFNTKRLLPNSCLTNQNKFKSQQSSISSTKCQEETKNSSDNKPPFVVGIVRYPLNPAASVPTTLPPTKTFKFPGTSVVSKKSPTKRKLATSKAEPSRIPVLSTAKQNRHISIPNPPLKSRPVAAVSTTSQRCASTRTFKAPAMPQIQASKKVSKVTEKRLAARTAAALKKPASTLIVKKTQEPEANKGIVSEKPKLNTTFEKEDTKVTTAGRKNSNVTKRKSRSLNKTQPNLNETFEKNSDGQIVLSKSIIASADLAAVNPMTSNLTATTSFFIPNDRASTPNTSVETVSLRVSMESKRFTSNNSKRSSSSESKPRRSSKRLNVSNDSQVNLNATFEIKEPLETSRTSTTKDQDQDHFENENAPRLERVNDITLERARFRASKNRDQSSISNSSSNRSGNSSSSKRKLLDTSIEDNDQCLISEDEQFGSKLKKVKYAKSKKTGSRENSLITDDESDTSDDSATLENKDPRKSQGRRTFDKSLKQIEAKTEIKEHSRKSNSTKSSIDSKSVSFLNDSTTDYPPVATARKSLSKNSFKETSVDESRGFIQKTPFLRRTRSLEKQNSSEEALLGHEPDAASTKTPLTRRKSNREAKSSPQFDSEVASQEPHETYDLLFEKNEAIRRKSSTPLPNSAVLQRATSVPDKSLRKSLLKSLSEDITPEAKRRSIHMEMPALFSPNITCSRGKGNARKEEMRRSLNVVHNSPNEDNIPTKETVMQTLNISQEEEEMTSQYFRFLANREIERLSTMRNEWLSKMPEAEIVSEEAKYAINQAVGQTNLLLKKKMQRFLSLVKDCEDGQGQGLVTCKDLQGFWDLTYIEVENCVNRFDYLHNLEKRNWIDLPEETLKQNAKPKPKAKLKTVVNKTKTATKLRPGGVMERIRALKAQNKGQEGNEIPMLLFEKQVKKFETPKKMIPDRERRTPSSVVRPRPSLSKESPLTMMKVSQFCKAPTVELDESITYVNSTQTPAKSILKNAEFNQSRKSMFKVNFHDAIKENIIELDEESASKRSPEEIATSNRIAAGLSKIESLRISDSEEENDEVIKESLVIRAEKQLNFDTSNTKTTAESDEDKENAKKTARKSRSDDESEEEVVTRSLRNRLVKTPVRGLTKKSKVLKKGKEQGETSTIITPPNKAKKLRQKSNLKDVVETISEDKTSSTTPRRKGTRRRTLNKTQENITEDDSSHKVIPVKAEFIKLHPSQQKPLPKTPAKRTRKMDQVAVDSPKRRATPR